MKTFCIKSTQILESFRWLSLLLFRLILSYGFLVPATEKMKNFPAVVQWFASLGIPMPYFSALLATTVEISGVILLFLGLFTRLISIPLMFLMCVAIFAVHWEHGFSAAANGFEIPLYYLLMLFSLFILGPGGISIDAIIKKTWLNQPSG